MIYMYILEGIALTGIAFNIDFHNGFFFYVYLSDIQSERKKKVRYCFLPWFQFLNVVPLQRSSEVTTFLSGTLTACGNTKSHTDDGQLYD